MFLNIYSILMIEYVLWYFNSFLLSLTSYVALCFNEFYV